MFFKRFYLAFLLIQVASIFRSSNCFNLENYENVIRDIIFDTKYQNDFNENLINLLKIDPNYFNFKLPEDRAFDCDLQNSNETATSVNKLRPSDIKVIGAIGDSLTAALGAEATNILQLLNEYRGVSWSCGGDSNLEKYFTIPNILKKFNPNLVGFSTGKHSVFTTKTGVAFNVAVTGQEANHILEQAKVLLGRIKESRDVDFENDWKLITIFIGGNDLCDFCKDRTLHSPESYTGFVQDTLDYLKQELPRTFVNLVSVLNISEVQYLNNGLVCSTLHRSSCPCGAFPSSDAEKEELKTFLQQYHELTENLINSGRYEDKDDFNVVIQPYYRDFTIPRLANGKVDFSYFAPDCFHFSLKGHAGAALGLWNNMLQPVGQKWTTWFNSEKLICPTKENPYFYTKKNSN